MIDLKIIETYDCYLVEYFKDGKMIYKENADKFGYPSVDDLIRDIREWSEDKINGIIVMEVR